MGRRARGREEGGGEGEAGGGGGGVSGRFIIGTTTQLPPTTAEAAATNNKNNNNEASRITSLQSQYITALDIYSFASGLASPHTTPTPTPPEYNLSR